MTEVSEIDKLLRDRRTVHSYRHEDFPDEYLEQALESAQYAPCHKFTYPWHFISVAREKRLPLVELSCHLKNVQDGEAQKKIEAKILNPYQLVIWLQQKSEDSLRSHEDYAACSCAIQNFQLSLWGHGIGSKWSTGSITRHSKIYSTYNISQDKWQIIGFIWAGIPANKGGKFTAPIRPKLSEKWTRI